MNRETLQKHLERGAVVLCILWLEVVFKMSTSGGFWPQLIYVALFSVAAGIFARFLLSFLPSRKANKIGKTAVMALLGITYCIEYFVYREFKHFYDLNTVTGGAGDATTAFAGEIGSLVFSLSGIVHIVLFLAPAIAYAYVGTGELLGEEGKDRFTTRIRMVRNAVAIQLVALLSVSTFSIFAHSYTDQYSFTTAVTNFGLLTGIRKDIQSIATGTQSKVNFTQADMPAQVAEPATPEQAPAQASAPASPTASTPQEAAVPDVAPSKNALDIDFAALANNTNDTWADLDRYVATLTPSSQNAMTGTFAGYNLIFVTAEAFSAEAIREDITPTLWRMAQRGIQFTDYYQFDSSGTTGGECSNIFGLLPTEGGNSVKTTVGHNNYYTMGSALDRLGYNGWAFHNNTYTYYSRDLTHENLGYSNGYIGYGSGMEDWVEWQWPQSDLEMVQGTFQNLYGDTKNEPFNVYYMSVSGHSGYLPGENAMSDKHASQVANLPYSDPVKGYLAANIELDAAMEYLIAQLEAKGMADHTAIVIAADHFPYGLDDDGPLGSLPYTSELYGYDVSTYFQRDHNRLIVWSGALEAAEPIVVDTPTSSIDILPTLLNLFGCEWDSRLLPGRDVFSDKAPLVFNLEYDWKTALGTYYAATNEFVAVEGAQIPEGYVDGVRADVANRINYCRGVLTSDYYRHIFGDPPAME